MSTRRSTAAPYCLKRAHARHTDDFPSSRACYGNGDKTSCEPGVVVVNVCGYECSDAYDVIDTSDARAGYRRPAPVESSTPATVMFPPLPAPVVCESSTKYNQSTGQHLGSAALVLTGAITTTGSGQAHACDTAPSMSSRVASKPPNAVTASYPDSGPRAADLICPMLVLEQELRRASGLARHVSDPPDSPTVLCKYSDDEITEMINPSERHRIPHASLPPHAVYVQSLCTAEEDATFHEMIEGKLTFVNIRIRNLNIDYAGFCRLRNATWLHDEIINSYLTLLQTRDSDLCRIGGCRGRRSLFFSSFFLEVLLPSRGRQRYIYNFSQVAKWTKCNVFDTKCLFFPLNLENSHWVLITVDMATCTVHYWDPMGGVSWIHIKGIVRWLRDEAEDKDVTAHSNTQWAVIVEKTTRCGGRLPEQRSSTECGVLLILCVSALSIDSPLDYTEDDAPIARRRIGCDLIRQSLGRIADREIPIDPTLDWKVDPWSGPTCPNSLDVFLPPLPLVPHPNPQRTVHLLLRLRVPDIEDVSQVEGLSPQSNLSFAPWLGLRRLLKTTSRYPQISV